MTVTLTALERLQSESFADYDPERLAADADAASDEMLAALRVIVRWWGEEATVAMVRSVAREGEAQ